jgi:signal peptidase complex subunit 1
MAFFRDMDFKGQELAELVLVRLMALFAAVGFIAGYMSSSFQIMALINGAGLVVLALLVVPPWPLYSRNPLPWLPPLKTVRAIAHACLAMQRPK